MQAMGRAVATGEAGRPAGGHRGRLAGRGAEPRLLGTTLLGLLGGTSVVVGAVLGGSTFVSHLRGAWFFGAPGGALGSLGHAGRAATTPSLLAVYGGLIVFCRAWLSLLGTLRRHRGVAVRRVIAVVAVWMIPFLLAPPLFSRDVYSYAGQGEMVSHHIDPYRYGTGVLGVTPFSQLPGPLWANTPSPYGPTFLAVDGLATAASGHDALVDLALLRLVELAGLALIALAVPTLARAVGRDPAHAVALGVGSPLALGTLIGGAHNDALMVGLMLAGVALAQRRRVALGLVVCALAAGVKAPAALAVVFIGWNWAGPSARVATRVGRTLLAAAIAAATLSVVSAVSGLGWGWLHTLTAAGKVFTAVTPVNTVARGANLVAQLLHVPVSFGAIRTGADVLGLAAGMALTAGLLWRSPRLGTVRALGLSLLVFALLGPILWAWYLSWGLVTLAPVATGWLRRGVVAVTVAGAFIGAASVRGVLSAVGHASIGAELALLAGLVVLVLVPLPFGPRRPPRPGGRQGSAPEDRPEERDDALGELVG